MIQGMMPHVQQNGTAGNAGPTATNVAGMNSSAGAGQQYHQMGQQQAVRPMQMQVPAQQLMSMQLGQQQQAMMETAMGQNVAMGQPPNLMGNQVPFGMNMQTAVPQPQHYQTGPHGNYSLLQQPHGQQGSNAYNQIPVNNMGIQQQPNAHNRGTGGGKFNFPCDNCDQYGHGTNYCPFPKDDMKIANKKAARIARNAEADDRQRRVNQILMDRGFHNAVSILPSERRAQRYSQTNVMTLGFSQGMLSMPGMQMGSPGPQLMQQWGSMSMTPPRCVTAPATVPVTMTTPDGRQMVVQMPAEQATPSGISQTTTPSPTTTTSDGSAAPTGEPHTPQHQVIPVAGIPQPEFSPDPGQAELLA